MDGPRIHLLDAPRDLSGCGHKNSFPRLNHILTVFSCVPSKSYSPFSMAFASLFMVPTTFPKDSLEQNVNVTPGAGLLMVPTTLPKDRLQQNEYVKLGPFCSWCPRPCQKTAWNKMYFDIELFVHGTCYTFVLKYFNELAKAKKELTVILEILGRDILVIEYYKSFHWFFV